MHDCAADFGRRCEGFWRQVEHNCCIRAPLGQEGKAPVGLGARLGDDTLGDFALEHER